MNHKYSFRLLWVTGLLVFVLVGCQGASKPAPVPTALPVVPTQVEIQQPVDPELAGVSPVSLPEKRADQASDPDSATTAKKKQAPGGDAFVADLFERPFNANTMDTYFPYYDIVDTQGFKDDAWGYATITLSGDDANGKLPGKYGVELDLNLDGRGDWLILVTEPASTDWSTQGVQVWQDANGDVGGINPIKADSSINGNGYETLVFDQGKDSSNPDGAWARISASDPKTVQLAFKLAMLGSPKFYAMGSWAGALDVLNPAQFDFNDHMTHLQAGDPMPDLVQVYPLKALYEIDNTCRLAVGFAVTGKEPGLCKTTFTVRQGDEPPPAQPNCRMSPTAAGCNPNGP